MSGIAGIYLGKNEKQLVKMLEKIKHRGPDYQRIAIGKNYALGNNILSFAKFSDSTETIFSEYKDKAIVFDGEIYNIHNLRTKLKNHRLKTDTSEEVILHLYEDNGPECVQKLDGVFSLAIIDRDKLLLARDPLGLQPLYTGKLDSKILFASEMKSLVAVGVERIEEFPPGYYFHSSSGYSKYYYLPLPEHKITNEQEIIKYFHKNFRKVVDKLVNISIPTGSFLSGGIDSSAVVSFLRVHIKNLKTFCVGTKNSPDVESAKEVANFFQTDHYQYVYSEKEVLEILPQVIYYLESFDAPLVQSSVANYFAAQLAKNKGCKIIFIGEGGDELFGGYHYLKNIKEGLNTELVNIINSLHNIGSLRVDRMNIAHSLQPRAPFLDLSLQEYALKIGPRMKIRKSVEKYIERKIFADYLPKTTIKRIKQPFSIGSGTTGIIKSLVEPEISDRELQDYRKKFPQAQITSKEELYYFKIFRKYFPPVSAISCPGKWLSWQSK